MVVGADGVVKERCGWNRREDDRPLRLNGCDSKECRRTKIEAVPTWVFLNGTDRSLDEILAVPHGSAENFHAGKEISNLELRGFRRIGTMHGIEFDIRSMRFADSSGIGFCRVGRPHQLAILLNGIVTL